MLTIILSPVFNAVIPPGRNSHSSDRPASTDLPWSSNPGAAVSPAGNDSLASAVQLEFAQQEGMTPHQDSCSQLHHRQRKVFITLYLTVQDQESRQNVSRSPVGTLVFHPAEEPECRSEVSGLSLVEDPARIDDVSPLYGEWHLRTLELVDQHPEIEDPDVVAAEVTTLQVRRQAASDLTEVVLVRHIGVSDAVDGIGFGRDRDAGIQVAGFDLVGPVREQLQKADFDDSVGLNPLARCLQIKDHERTLQADVLQHGHTSGWLISELPTNLLSHDRVSS